MIKCNYEGGLKSSYDHVISAVDDFVLPMGSKYCNTNKKMWTARGTMSKNEPHLVTYHESILASL